MTAGTSHHPFPSAAMLPTNVAAAIPKAARTTAVTRVRENPWNVTNPAGIAPSAAKAPYSRWPVTRPTASGVTIPAPARSAPATRRSAHRNGPKFSHPPCDSPAASARRLARNQAASGAQRSLRTLLMTVPPDKAARGLVAVVQGQACGADVLPPVTGIHGRVPLPGQGGQQRQRAAVRGLDRQVHVLERPLQRELRRVVAPLDLVQLGVRDGRVQRAALDRFGQPVGVDAQPASQLHRLRDAFDE